MSYNKLTEKGLVLKREQTLAIEWISSCPSYGIWKEFPVA
jgi:hypothetical protein